MKQISQEKADKFVSKLFYIDEFTDFINKFVLKKGQKSEVKYFFKDIEQIIGIVFLTNAIYLLLPERSNGRLFFIFCLIILANILDDLLEIIYKKIVIKSVTANIFGAIYYLLFPVWIFWYFLSIVFKIIFPLSFILLRFSRVWDEVEEVFQYIDYVFFVFVGMFLFRNILYFFTVPIFQILILINPIYSRIALSKDISKKDFKKEMDKIGNWFVGIKIFSNVSTLVIFLLFSGALMIFNSYFDYGEIIWFVLILFVFYLGISLKSLGKKKE